MADSHRNIGIVHLPQGNSFPEEDVRWISKYRNNPVQVLHLERETRQLKTPKHHERPHSMSALTELDLSANKGNSTLPTPEDKLREISRSQPVTLVPIDVSGSSFTRMCDYRSSLRGVNAQYEEVDTSTLSRSGRRRSKRRQTLSGLPGFVFNEVNTDYLNASLGTLRTRSVSRERWERPRSMAFTDTYDARGKRGRSRERKKDKLQDRDESPVTRSCSLRRSFRSLFHKSSRSRSQDLWAEGRPRSPGPPVIDINMPLRRSRSLPRSLKSVMRDSSTSKLVTNRSASTEGRLDGWTEEELFERDIPWVRAKPPAGPSRPVRGPRLPRSRSQTVERRRSSYVESSDDSSVGPSRPQSLRTSVSHSQLRLPIPVSMPTTPGSAESLVTGPTIDKYNRMNIPARGAAWGPFASVKLRHAKGNGPDDRQSSSGNWSASSSSARQSLESEYNNRLVNSSPEKRSLTSLDKDSALSLNIHSSSEDRYTTDNNGDLGEETSTITGDTSTLNGGDTTAEDASTINGDTDSVINVKANFTRMKTDEWLKSIRKEKKSRRKSHLDSSENGSGLTLQNLRAHDSAHKPFVRSLTRLPDEESSVYSVDGEGFYTSMHRDSGLKRCQSEMIEEETQFELESLNSSSNSTLANRRPPPKSARADKVKRRSTSFLSNLPGLKKIKGSGKGKLKKTPPPPPRRASTGLDKSNLTLDKTDGSPSTPSSELSKSADTSTETVINTGIQPQSQARHNDSSCESDAEAIYARIKSKSSISSAAIPSLCSVTPICSDEEDADLLSFARTWRANSNSPSYDTSTWSGSLMSTRSAPGSLLDGKALTSTPIHTSIGIGRLNSSGNRTNDDLSISDTMTQMNSSYTQQGELSPDTSGFSTWPRSPSSKGEKPDGQKAPCPPRTLNFVSPGFNPREVGSSIPEGQTPEERHNNSFVGSNDGSDKDGCSSKGTLSLKSPSTSSIPSSISEDMPVMPPKLVMRPSLSGGKNPYLPHMADGASLSGGSGGSACTSPVNKSNHVFANVIVKPFLPSSASSMQAGSNATLPSKSHSSTVGSVSVTSTWPRSLKTGKDKDKLKDKIKDGGSLNKKDIKKLSTFAPLEKEDKEDEEDENEESLTQTVNTYSGPVPAHAKLIISAPVATKVSFKENPYKRAVCSPVTTEELMSFWNVDVKGKPYDTVENGALEEPESSSGEPSPSAFTKVLPSSPTALGPPKPAPTIALSKPLYPTLSSMKHSISFSNQEEIEPISEDAKEPEEKRTYGGSWYDGIKTKSEVVPITTSLVSSSPRPSLKSYTSLSSFNSELSTTSNIDQRRDSISSNVSSDSGSKKHVTFATINKASPSNSQFSVKMDDGTASLTGSITGSIGSNESNDKKLTFSSFTKPISSTSLASVRRNSSGSTASIKSTSSATSLPVQMPIPPDVGQTVTKSASPSPVFHRPTSLALSKVTDIHSSRLSSIGEGTPSEELPGSPVQYPEFNSLGRLPKKSFDPRGKVISSDKKEPLQNSTFSGNRSLNSPVATPSEDNKSVLSNDVKKQESVGTNTALGMNRRPVTARVSPIMKTDSSRFSRLSPTKTVIQTSPPSSPTKSPLPKAEPVKFRIPKTVKDFSKNDDLLSKKETYSSSTKIGVTHPVKPCASVFGLRTEKQRSPVPVSPSKDSVSDRKDSSIASLSNSNSSKESNKVLHTSENNKKDSEKHGSPSKAPTSPHPSASGDIPCFSVAPRTSVSPQRKSASPIVNKPPISPATKSSPTLKQYDIKSKCSTGASSPPTPLSTSSALTSSRTSLASSIGNDSVCSVNKSSSSLDLSSSSLKGSKLSLNKSTDSLASNSSASSVVERTRAARLAFLGQGTDNSVDGSKSSGTGTGTPPSVKSSVDDRFAKYKIRQRKGSTGSSNSGGSAPGSPPNNISSQTSTGPSQGRFVNSVISTLATKSGSESPTSPTTPSSGLGSSIASPLSPVKHLPSELSTLENLNSNNNNNISGNSANSLLLNKKKETCC